MNTIRRQSIISSLIIYFGFAIGLLNTYLFTKQGLFTEAQYGLTSIFISIATIMMAFAQMAIPSYIYKFFPYYQDRLLPKKNDMLTWALVVSSVAFLLVIAAGVIFKDLVVRKFGEHSPELLPYYNWIFVMGYGLLIYTVLEAYAWQFHKSVLTNYLREVQWRLFITIIIVLFVLKLIPDYSLFIKLFAFTYPGIAIILFGYLLFTNRVHFTFKPSKVTKRHFKNILRLCSFIYGGSLIFTIAQVFDSIVIGSLLGLGKVGIYTLAQNISALIQAPQRGIVSASIAHLSKAWKEKDMSRIQRIYQRSSINQLIFSCGLYVLITINFIDAVNTFHLQESYLQGFYVFLLLGAVKIVDMGTGVNSQIIGTSTYWRFEMTSGIVLLLLTLPLNYFLTKQFDIVGPGIANLISISIYNAIRIIFLWKKFRFFPFTAKTIYTVLLAGFCFLACYYAFVNLHGWAGLIARSAAFCLLYAAGVLTFRLSPDVLPVWQTFKKKIGIN
ncbi:MAG: polysaccharide biosynthesis protein [Chitinophagaceae bacterium]